MERRKFTREFKLEAVRLIKQRGVSYVQASQDLGVHVSQLRDWVKKFADDPEHAFPGHGQMKPEQLEIARLKREVTKLKAERDILKREIRFRCEAPRDLAGGLVVRGARCLARRVLCLQEESDLRAFFRMSRSAFSLVTSRLSRAISSCSGFIWPWPGNACCGSSANFFTQSRNCDTCTLRSCEACT